jgi:repressor LexA
MTISARQERILTVIRDWVDERGYPPTIRELATATGAKSTSTVAYHLGVLERGGYLRRDPHSPRAVDVRSSVDAAVRVPVLGAIAAGPPITAEQQVEDELILPEALVGTGTLFALNVRGDSMIEAAICDGDVVVVRRQPVAENGEIVAAMLDGEATVKVYRARDGHVQLLPRNPAYTPIDGDRATILGKVVCVLRRM